VESYDKRDKRLKSGGGDATQPIFNDGKGGVRRCFGTKNPPGSFIVGCLFFS
jgi:hypothetical protein